MSELSNRERLLKVLRREPVDRPPVICTGGMMNAAVVGIMKKTGHTLPEAHFDGALMARLAADVHHETGFENFGVPFCMTVEAEVLGSDIDAGTLSCEPKIEKERYSSVSAVELKDTGALLSSGRIGVVTDAIKKLSNKYPSVPVIGMLTGPVSLAASIVDPMTFFRELRKNPKDSHRVLHYVSTFLGAFAEAMIKNGAGVVAIGDPSATGEILGPKVFEEYALPYLNRVTDVIHSFGTPAILHVCGDIKPVKRFVPSLKADAVSTDAVVSLKGLKQEFPEVTTMGNVSTYLLEFGGPAKVQKKVKQLILDGVDIISPACGLSTSTPLRSIRAITQTVKEHSGNGAH